MKRWLRPKPLLLTTLGVWLAITLSSFFPCALCPITSFFVPSNVRIVACASAVTDNLFHVTTYWQFEHSPEGLAALLEAVDAGEHYEDFTLADGDFRGLDTYWAFTSISDALALDVRPDTIGRGYEIERRRDNWLLVSKSGETSYFAQNSR